MREYIKKYEKYIVKLLSQGEISTELLNYHQQQLKFLQHERMVHLFVMLVTIIIFLATTIILYISAKIAVAILWGILLLLTTTYIIHYYYLENSVQRWYKIANFLEKKLTGVGVNTEELKLELEE